MKVLEKIVEVEKEGFFALFGQTVTIFALNYIWVGKLVGVNDTQIKLEKPKIVFETGAFNTKSYKTAEALPNDMYIRTSAIEAYGVVKEE